VNAIELFKAGKLQNAIDALGVELRSDPTDTRRRTFLFELLCFAGDYDRAEKQLDILASAGKEAQMGALLYRSALHAQRLREEKIGSGDAMYASPPDDRVSGTVNGKPFTRIRDADPRLGARLEVYAAGQYMWIPFEHLASVETQPPAQLRDLMWMPAIVRTGPSFKGMELGEMLLPSLTPFSWDDESDEVRLGRVTEWVALESGHEVPIGRKLLLIDDEEVSLLDIRELVITPAPGNTS
jgi:type VI secretion system protein ImpE